MHSCSRKMEKVNWLVAGVLFVLFVLLLWMLPASIGHFFVTANAQETTESRTPRDKSVARGVQPIVYRQGPGPGATPTPEPNWQTYTDPSGSVSFEYPEDWTITVLIQTDTALRLAVDSPHDIDGEINMEDRMLISISTVPHDKRKHYPPWCVRRIARQTHSCSEHMLMMAPVYVLDALGFVYVQSDYVPRLKCQGDACVIGQVHASFYNIEDELMVSITGGLAEDSIREKVDYGGLLYALQDDHYIFLHLVDTLRIDVAE